jgi:transposase-like protein
LKKRIRGRAMNLEKIVPLTRESGLKLAKAFEISGLSRKDFCSKHKIKPHILYYWRQTLKDEIKESGKAGFIAVQLPAEQARKQQILKINFKDDLVIEAPSNLQSSELINLFKACQACG